MIVKVTQEDIDNGVKHSNADCPVACAASRTVGKVLYFDPYGEVLDGYDEVSVWAKRFDAGEVVFPFEFDFPEGDLIKQGKVSDTIGYDYPRSR